MKGFRILILSTAVFIGCKSNKNVIITENKNRHIFLSMERTPCYGTCENYKILIYTNGYCVYEGKNFVEKIGKYESVISNEKIESLKKKVNEVNFFSLENVYNHPGITDIPATITEVNLNGNTKKIENRYQGPPELKSLELFIDSVIKELPLKKISE